MASLAPAQKVFDELLEEIFILLPTAADLARASMACVSFGRVIAGHGFLRRFRALHPPPLLGILHLPFLPAQPPHPSAAAARTLANAGADFWCSFLPNRERWGIADVRDGRVLLAGVPEGKTYRSDRLLKHFAVCDPVHRRHLQLPAIPDDLTALVDGPNTMDYFLAPPAQGEDDMSFTVICLARCRTKLVTFFFPRGAGEWRTVSFDSGSKLSLDSRRCYWRRCFCWSCRVTPRTNKLLMLDTDTMEFSAIDLPPRPWPEEYEVKILAPCDLTFVDAPEGRLGMFSLYHDIAQEDEDVLFFHLGYAILREDKGSVARWESKAMIPLPLTYEDYQIIGVAGGYLLVQGTAKPRAARALSDGAEREIFSLNLTFQLARFCVTSEIIDQDENNLYAGYPPSLSAPTI